jgi:predicted dehydrogenase
MKFLIAGFGSIGRRHLRNLIALGQRDIVLLRSNKSTLPTDEIDDFPVVTSLEAALADKPDAVLIATPTALHLGTAIPAAEAGCHIFIEKPVAEELEGIGALEAALKRGGGRLLVGFQFRFHPTLQIASRLLQDGAIGRPVFARAHWGEYLPDWHPWEDYRQSYAARSDLGGGVVRTLCHPLDYLGWLFGNVRQVYGIARPLPELELSLDSLADALLDFEQGLIGAVHLDYVQRPPQHTLEIVGTKGTILWDNSSGNLTLAMPGNAPANVFSPPEGFERNQMFLEQMRHFLQVVQGLEEPVCSLADGKRALALALAILESSRMNKPMSI